MKRQSVYIFALVATVIMAAVACSGYGSKIEELQHRIDHLREECNTLGDNAKALDELVGALQQGSQLVSFAPISAYGEVTGYKVTFKDAGEITLYNQTTDVSIAEYDGHYYWTAGGFWLRDASGNKIEVGVQNAVIPEFKVEEGIIRYSVDSGTTWRKLPESPVCFITKVVEDARGVAFTFGGGATIFIPKYEALTVSLEGDNLKVSAGDIIRVGYTIDGIKPESKEIRLEILCGDGWSYQIIPANGTSGQIEITAPNPISDIPVVLLVSDAEGRAVAVQMRFDIDISGNTDPPVPPDEPVNEPILVPVKTVITMPIEGGQAEAGLITNAEYEVTTDASWLHWIGTKAIRTDNLLFNVDPNDDIARTATATISSGNYSTSILFRQEGVIYYIHLSERRLDIDVDGGSAAFSVSTNAPYSCVSSADWLTIEKTASTPRDEYMVTASENVTYETREATITIISEKLGRRTLEVVQRGKYADPVPHTCIPVCHIMPCCRTNNTGTKFLVGGYWTAAHDYQQIDDVRSILQHIKDAGINVISIDFTNASQWDDFGQSALHNGDGGEFWYKFGPMLDNIVQVCAEKDMKYVLFLGNTLAPTTTLEYWNFIAGVVLERWASDPHYLHYGFGDDRPVLIMFVPGSNFARQLRNAPLSQKNNLQQFHIGTCQVNSPITPTTTDGWGYRNYSSSSDGKVRFACPNSGVPPQDWARVDAEEWKRRVTWVLGATEYAVIGSYDDTCDAIFWGIADVSRSITDYHRNMSTASDPYIYYNIVRDSLK